jgi:23S rRNA (cytidine1920-2'-O)/16S rRNA (cytidine1409-2'-O)-methyltransferase
VAPRRRLDAELVRRGLSSSRREASDLIGAGRVLVAGAIADKAARLVSPAEAIEVSGPPPRFVSRGGEKLDAALEAFELDVTGRRALDAGASTGGFTDVLLQRGAAHVVALDVGHAQLHERIRHDPRVTVIERYNVRHLAVADIGGPVEVVVADLSFISLKVVLAALFAALCPGGDLVVLVKPQFEAGRQEVAKGRGVITDPEVHRRVRGEIEEALRSLNAVVVGWTTSPIHGADGNIEFLVHARAPEGSP